MTPSQTPIRTATVLVNPAARRVARRFDSKGAMHFLARHGVDARLVIPESTARAAEAAANLGHDAVFVVGGDGTLRQAAAGLAGSDTALAAIPAGTTNIWAKEAGIPPGIRTAFEAHLRGQRVRMDLGRANGEAFLLMASAGWDAEVVGTVDARLKSRIGQGAYFIAAARLAVHLHSRQVRLRSGLVHWDVPLAMVVISNTRLYGGHARPSPGATANDGMLDLCALCPAHRGDGTRLLGKLAVRRLRGDIRAITARVQDVTLETAGIPYQLDGDAAGLSPLEVHVEPGGLMVSVPAGPLPPIFGG